MTAPGSPSDPHAAIDASGVVAIIRGSFLADIDQIIESLIAGGIAAIEISLTSPFALDQIERASLAAGTRAAIGAGTVMHRDDVQEVFRRGATFVVAPIVDEAVIAAALDLSMLPLPGAFTPTEVVRAVRLGARAVKLFPADALGPAFVRAVLAPFPSLELVPTGGVTLSRAADFAAAGAWAVGVGTPLVAEPLELASLTARAAQFVRTMRPGASRLP
jgi:2-dehydro-3-deoxyphosphogluconate aldolase / (4S)-4-hydroxy-2-oxoglutarate aldolase